MKNLQAIGAGMNPIARFGSRWVRQRELFPASVFPEATDADRKTLKSVRAFTMTSDERIWALISAVRYVVSQGISGDFVECGVWRGGSVLSILLTLRDMGVTDRRVWLYDTFEGMSDPTAKDVEQLSGRPASQMLSTSKKDGENLIWAYATKGDVNKNLVAAGYPSELLTFREGDVLETLAQEPLPSKVALLRLDTDWYESTLFELEVLYPRLSSQGVCIIDDYGHWQGARAAVDEYFRDWSPRPLLQRIDYTGRLIVKA